MTCDSVGQFSILIMLILVAIYSRIREDELSRDVCCGGGQLF